jgi:hypothetical protein
LDFEFRLTGKSVIGSLKQATPGRANRPSRLSGVEDFGPVVLKGQPNPARVFKVA